MRVIMYSHWHPNANGTDYYAAVGNYPSLEAARGDATDIAHERYEWLSEEEQDENGMEDEGPDVTLYDYDNDEGGPQWFDDNKEGGGSFENEF